jgi:hypothetical protein
MKKIIAILGMATFLGVSVPYVSAANAKHNTTLSVEKHKKSGKKAKNKIGASEKTSQSSAQTQGASATPTTK